MQHSEQKIFIALPAMNEMDYISACINSVLAQTYKNFQLIICINQPEDYWISNSEICKNNADTLDYLNNLKHPQIEILDKYSLGNGWTKGKEGIGYARKTLMDHIVKKASSNDIILSMDADTTFEKNYFESIVAIFNSSKITAISNPYYHKLTNDIDANRAILRYEIYMRNYIINLLLINSPYAYTALGSAIAVKVCNYNSVGGLTPKKSGEDFYFLQKLRKFGKIGIYNSQIVYPAARFSNRVFFGTGPAMIKGHSGDWDSYPMYHFKLFQQIKETYFLFPELYKANRPTPLDEFILQTFGEAYIWSTLRANNKDSEHFVKACHDKIDGLRVLQFLKSAQGKINLSDEVCYLENCKYFGQFGNFIAPTPFNSFNDLDVEQLDIIRNQLFLFEEELRKKHQTV